MIDPPTPQRFTAQQVREKADSNRSNAQHDVEDWREIVAMLDQFAARLAQEEQTPTVVNDRTPQTVEIPRGFIEREALREAGRNEVYSEIANMNPFVQAAGSADSDGTYCVFCSQWARTKVHLPTCLYLRACQAVAGTPQKA